MGRLWLAVTLNRMSQPSNIEVQKIRDQISAIEARLASGVTQVTTDGTTTSVSLEALERQRARLERKLSAMVQPISATVDLSHG